ncbi:hypothetical protein AB0N09_05810 [Streptomyces erythrochromogenes]|uniref:hypothetical protein n=1 Tax=Streptomyces erythrochromogenes TaxID=285574 RepID=UPI003447B5B3
MAIPVLSPLVSERIWALPIGAAAVKFLHYLVYRSDFGGALPVRQKQMAIEYKVVPSTVSTMLEQLVEVNIVLRAPGGVGKKGNTYCLHPLAAKYESSEAMEAGWRQALLDMKAGRLVGLNLPEYQTVPPAEGSPDLRVA